VSGVRCTCGRFLARAYPIATHSGEGYAAGYRLTAVQGDCARCGKDVSAGRGDDAWWWDWDAWSWPDEVNR
jgi:hypothetical protein